MKNSVIILGIALVSFSVTCNAKNVVNLPYNLFKTSVLSDENTGMKNNKEVKFEKPSLIEDVEVFNPEAVITSNPKTIKEIIVEGDEITEYTDPNDLEFMEYEESMRGIIAQYDLITENIIPNTTYPLYIETTIEDEIAKLELIIESNETNKVNPLDFKKINSNSMMSNSFNTEKMIGMN